jgi:hypothetical protein
MRIVARGARVDEMLRDDLRLDRLRAGGDKDRFDEGLESRE